MFIPSFMILCEMFPKLGLPMRVCVCLCVSQSVSHRGRRGLDTDLAFSLTAIINEPFKLGTLNRIR